LIGLLVPLGGRYRAAGREVLRGAVEASGALGGHGKARLAIAVRDSSRAPETAARQLIDTEGVVALIGTLDPGSAKAVASVASRSGVPFIALSRFKAAAEDPVLQLLPDNRMRAEALARHAVKSGARRLAVLAPDTRYGQAMARTFEQRARALGGSVVHKLTYPAGTRSFSKLAAKLLKAPRFEALFIPDRAHALILVAPALAKTGLWPAPRAKAGGAKRTIQLLATADGLTGRMVASAGRYIQGITVAPGFYPDENAGGSGPLVRRFRRRQGRAPSLLAALAFDAVEVVRVLRERRGGLSRVTLRAALTGGKAVQGMTGMIRFTPSGQRSDPPLLYRVEGNGVRLIPSR
jgi:branched-chain amino acid transport system substrate-binding protein